MAIRERGIALARARDRHGVHLQDETTRAHGTAGLRTVVENGRGPRELHRRRRRRPRQTVRRLRRWRRRHPVDVHPNFHRRVTRQPDRGQSGLRDTLRLRVPVNAQRRARRPGRTPGHHRRGHAGGSPRERPHLHAGPVLTYRGGAHRFLTKAYNERKAPWRGAFRVARELTAAPLLRRRRITQLVKRPVR